MLTIHPLIINTYEDQQHSSGDLMQYSVIRTQDLTKTYSGVVALDHLRMEIPEHSIVGFLGPNGAGKSTTIKLLLGLIHPTKGSGEIFGQDIQSDSLKIRHRIGYLAQNPRFYSNLTARETLRFVARFFFVDSMQIEARVDESLKIVDLDKKADRPIKGFSGGEMQRLGIAQAQINRPELLILDEPAAALDPMGRADVLNIMQRLREISTIFYSTHILDDVQRVSDRVVILNKGRLVCEGPIEELLVGDGEAVYNVELMQHNEGTLERIKALPWVSQVIVAAENGRTRWSIAISDEQLAHQDLLRTMLQDEEVQILKYGRRKYELEEIFIDLVGEDS
jgi:ABC-2 type transport system ATP-binding protein